MKKAILFQLILLFPCFMMGFSSSAILQPPPIDGNWLDPMQGGEPENLSNRYVYIYLDQNEELDLHLIATTTDFEMQDYDSLHIRWTFGSQTGVTELITKDHMSPIAGGYYQATMPVTIDFSSECSDNPPNTFAVNVLLELVTPKLGDYDIYPMEANEGLFDPNAFEDLNPILSTAKILLCWGATPPPNMVEHNEMTVTSNSENDAVLAQESIVNSELENKEITRDIAVFPNPFSNSFQLQYHLDQPSEIQFRIVDMQGALIQHQKLQHQSKGIHTQSFSFEDNLSHGIYMIHLYYSDKVKTAKLMKLKSYN